MDQQMINVNLSLNEDRMITIIIYMSPMTTPWSDV